MTEPTCRWFSTTQPRVIPGRHDDQCEGESCRGCQPCEEAHCRVCGVTHDVCCPGCRDEARTNLAEIKRMCDDLPEEVEHRGVNGEAMNLLGPVADPEAWGHRQASAAVGRIDQAWLESADHANHPLFVLASWEDVWREALDHESGERATIEGAAAYLDLQLTYMAGYEHAPFEDFARDLRTCVAHMESVLHDGAQVDQGVPCMTCHKPLVRVWGAKESADGWKCPRCRQESTEDQYRFAVKAHYIETADWLGDADMTTRTGVKAGTVRAWARETNDRPALVRKKRESERTLYRVADVLAAVKAKGMAA